MSFVVIVKNIVMPAVKSIGSVVIEWLHWLGAISPGTTIVVQGDPEICSPSKVMVSV
jgi:hypothetical protein